MKEQYLKALGAKIRKVRMQKRMSLVKLSRLTETAYTNLIDIEFGRKNCRILTLKAIAEALEIEMRELL